MIYILTFLSLLLFNPLALALTEYQEKLIKHVNTSIKNAEMHISKLSPEVLLIPGMSSGKGRHLLNNICTLPEGRYLEIGTWQGSTFISALYNNHERVRQAYAIDNWSEFGGPKTEFLLNTQHYIPSLPFKLYEGNCFQLNLDTAFDHPINIYFYDGDHSFQAQKSAFTYFNNIFDETFIAIIDDYDWVSVHSGTQAAFEELNYEILYEKHLVSNGLNDAQTWWNGIYVAVISKK